MRSNYEKVCLVHFGTNTFEGEFISSYGLNSQGDWAILLWGGNQSRGRKILNSVCSPGKVHNIEPLKSLFSLQLTAAWVYRFYNLLWDWTKNQLASDMASFAVKKNIKENQEMIKKYCKISSKFFCFFNLL